MLFVSLSTHLFHEKFVLSMQSACFSLWSHPQLAALFFQTKTNNQSYNMLMRSIHSEIWYLHTFRCSLSNSNAVFSYKIFCFAKRVFKLLIPIPWTATSSFNFAFWNIARFCLSWSAQKASFWKDISNPFYKKCLTWSTRRN